MTIGGLDLKYKKIISMCNTLSIELETIIGINSFDIMLFGSAVLNDFHYGYSDIDIIVLSYNVLTELQISQLLELRHSLVKNNNEPDFRLLEGIIIYKNDFLYDGNSKLVYWGTSGESIKELNPFMPCDILSIKNHGILIYGHDFRESVIKPTYEELLNQVKHTYKTIRRYGKINENSHSLGWFFDTARSIYTIKTSKITSKTNAVKWVIDNDFYHDKILLVNLIKLRNSVSLFENSEHKIECVISLNKKLQEFADTLEMLLL